MTKSYCEKDKYGHIFWYKENTNIYHKENGPAVEYSTGGKKWYLNGKLHREDGPAIESNYGYKQWWQNGLCHRTDGPAIIKANGDKEYWLNDIWYEDIKSNEEWLIFQIIN